MCHHMMYVARRMIGITMGRLDGVLYSLYDKSHSGCWFIESYGSSQTIRGI